MNFSVRGHNGAQISIDIIQRERPDDEDYWDGNWLVSNIKVIVPGFIADFRASLRAEELSDFFSQLKQTYSDLKSVSNLQTMEECISIEITPGKLGELKICGQAFNLNSAGGTLAYEFDSDQSFLSEVIANLQKIVESYPVVGKQSK